MTFKSKIIFLILTFFLLVLYTNGGGGKETFLVLLVELIPVSWDGILFEQNVKNKINFK